MRWINISTELFSELKDANQRVTRWFIGIPAEDFFTRHGEVWSASDNVDHLIKSHKPISKALKLPKFTLQAMFENLKDNPDLTRKFVRFIETKSPEAHKRRGVFFQSNKARSRLLKKRRLNC
jgi:hypothetical protein